MKRLTQTLAFCLLTVFTAVAQKNYVSEVWVSDLGNGKYKNPVLYADYSDPDACRVGDDFYMTSSSFNCLPGLQILHSKDLVNWTIIGAAVPNALSPIETPERPEHGNRVWALVSWVTDMMMPSTIFSSIAFKLVNSISADSFD